MLSTRSNPTYDPPAPLSYHCDNHLVPFLDAEHSETDCPTETETETPPDSPVRLVTGSSSNNKSAVNIVQATNALGLIAKQPITRRSAPDIGDDPGYVAEGETEKILVGGKRAKKAFPAPEGSIWFRRRASSNSQSPSPRGGPSNGIHRTTPLASRSASPALRLGVAATPRELSPTRPVALAGQPSTSPKGLTAAIQTPLAASAIVYFPSTPGVAPR
ncbi:hypothetical protein M407DRAFT_22129 [Tulasnella calospora MUT 4182]|uniref:Uncharacterized protein n=1 Tax=Tulasnella calospora MUT 4182 TaxID=1051891 RepID=A0A0C3QLW8_9AGAM|nr:hypothetical protein M407DRAFT_22129 [Tulasnella calospora MUT 4182]